MRYCRAIRVLGVLLALSGADFPAAGAQSRLVIPGLTDKAADDATKPPELPEPAAAKRAENAELLRVAQRKLEAVDQADSPAAQILAQEVALHQTLDAVLAQQEVVEGQIKDLTARRVELGDQLVSATSSGGKPADPLTFAELDRLKDELAAERSRAQLINDRLTALKTTLEKAQQAHREADRRRRQAQEASQMAREGPNAAELAAAAEQTRQAAKLAQETVELRQREVAREQLSQEVQRLAVQLAGDRVARASPHVVFREADLENELAEIGKREETTSASLERANNNRLSVNARLREAQEELEAETGDRSVLTEKVESLRRNRERILTEIDSLTQRLKRFAQLRLAWNRRFQLASPQRWSDSESWKSLREWQGETTDVLAELEADLRAQISQMRDLRSSLTSIAKKADAARDGPSELTEWIDKQRTHVEATLRIRERNLATIDDSRRVHEKLLDEIGRGTQTLNASQMAFGALAQLKEIWSYELANIEDGTIVRSITVGKIVTGLLIFVVGWFASGVSATMVAGHMLQRFRLSKDATAAIRTIIFYVLLMIAAVMALRSVNVPLTAFTILGGALAIGVGFGSQALINNFIGGLIMLAERPVRLGERITFGNYDGVVEDVGFRCTKLRTLTDHLVTIPNSTLVNDSIENLARRRTIRRLLNVTITYDTPRDKIAAAVQAIRNILEEKDIRERIHPIVGLDELRPRVFFNDFNSESLNILVLYWYAPPDWWDYMEHCERVNFRILEELERLGVDFAFPSRTLYLAKDPQRDLTVRLLEGAEAGKSAA